MEFDPDLEGPAAVAVIGSAHQIWLAGLGAFARAEREGSKFFESLVEEGEHVEATIKRAADKKVNDIKDKATDIKDKATDTWNKLEQVFQKRVARALNRLGVPTSDDIQMLYRQVEELRNNVNELARMKDQNILAEKPVAWS